MSDFHKRIVFIETELRIVTTELRKIIMQNAELYAAVTALQPTLNDAAARITAKLVEVEAALATCNAGVVPQPVIDAITATTAAVATLNNLVPAPVV